MSEQWIVGINPVRAVLEREDRGCHELAIEQGQRNPRLQALQELARARGLSVQQWSRDQLERCAEGARHQGVALRCEAGLDISEGELPALVQSAGETALLLVLDGVTDPHNLGACLRSAAAAGACAVVVPKDRSAGLTAVARRAAAGGAEQIPLVAVTNLARTLRQLKQDGVWLTGLSGDADTSLYALDFQGPVALVLGGEGEGLRRLTRDTCDFLGKIPMPGGIESLNVSVAAGLALFEVLRQRGALI